MDGRGRTARSDRLKQWRLNSKNPRNSYFKTNSNRYENKQQSVSAKPLVPSAARLYELASVALVTSKCFEVILPSSTGEGNSAHAVPLIARL